MMCCNQEMYETRTLDKDKHGRFWWICKECKRQKSKRGPHRLIRKDREGLKETPTILKVPKEEKPNLSNEVAASLVGDT